VTMCLQLGPHMHNSISGLKRAEQSVGSRVGLEIELLEPLLESTDAGKLEDEPEVD